MAWLRIKPETGPLTLHPLYSPQLLRLAAEAAGAGTIGASEMRVTCVNPVCGDRIDVTAALGDGTLTRLVYEIAACVICQASASALGAHAVGRTFHEIAELHDQVAAMLKAGGPPPAPPFSGFRVLQPVAGEPARHTCVLLPFTALTEALARLGQTA